MVVVYFVATFEFDNSASVLDLANAAKHILVVIDLKFMYFSLVEFNETVDLM